MEPFVATALSVVFPSIDAVDESAHEGAPIGIDLPPSMELVVVRTEPPMKSATVSNVNKPATLENGVTIQVPPFVNEGDRIRVDPTEGRYIERAK